MSRLAYWRRIAAAYLIPGRSQLTFWHETPAVNERADPGRLGEYWMPFADKADYPGPFDPDGVPQLDYHGRIGLQYNPIAIAQYGLANYNAFVRTRDPERRRKALRIADWLVRNLEPNAAGLRVWMHHFDWEYRSPLRAPWYSGLAQGQGISMLLRAHAETGEARYLEAAREAFVPMTRTTADGGVIDVDSKGFRWIEEYLVTPPTHILNGLIWALWGVYDLHLATSDPQAKALWDDSLKTLRANLSSYDTGFWSLYEQSGTRMRMVASRFYHRLHIVQLRVMRRLTGEPLFAETADRWEAYAGRRWNRSRAFVHKAVFKVFYY